MVDHSIEIVDYRPEHGEHIAAHMREIDRREIYYMAALRPLPAVQMTAARSVAAWTGLLDGEPASIFGINRRSSMSDIGVPWLLGAEAMDRAPMAVAKASRIYFDRMDRAFDRMENHALAENVATIRWLKWLGFDMDEPKPFGAFQVPFCRFGKGLH